MNPVQIADLEARFRPLTDTEKITAQALLDDAWEEIKARVPGIEARLAAAEVSVGLIRKVVAAMTIRVLRNPDGVKSWAVDDYSQTRDSSIAAGALYLSEDEIALLGGSTTSTEHLAGSMQYRSSWL